jgi:hypothetical protein
MVTLCRGGREGSLSMFLSAGSIEMRMTSARTRYCTYLYNTYIHALRRPLPHADLPLPFQLDSKLPTSTQSHKRPVEFSPLQLLHNLNLPPTQHRPSALLINSGDQSMPGPTPAGSSLGFIISIDFAQAHKHSFSRYTSARTLTSGHTIRLSSPSQPGSSCRAIKEIPVPPQALTESITHLLPH